MRNKVEIDGKWYELVPLEEKESESNPTFYYGCDSECGFFSFNILLNDDGDIWYNTESVTYYPYGCSDKSKAEYWDNSDFLNALIDNPTDPYVIETKALIDNHSGKIEDLIHLLKQVRSKGWLTEYRT